MGTTPLLGFPFPEDTDPVAQGAAAIEALAAAAEAYLTTPGFTAADPVVRQGGSTWVLGDFGANGDTAGWYRTRAGVVEGWALAVQNGNGPTFPPTGAGVTHVKLPVVPGELPNRHVVGEWFYQSHDQSAQGSGILRLDTTFIAIDADWRWARLSANLNSNNQYSLGIKWHYAVDL